MGFRPDQLCVSPRKSLSSVRPIHHVHSKWLWNRLRGPLKEGLGEGRKEGCGKAVGLQVSGSSYSLVNDLAAAPGEREMTIIAFNAPRGMIWKQEA